jgi:hypothetical protein
MSRAVVGFLDNMNMQRSFSRPLGSRCASHGGWLECVWVELQKAQTIKFQAKLKGLILKLARPGSDLLKIFYSGGSLRSPVNFISRMRTSFGFVAGIVLP